MSTQTARLEDLGRELGEAIAECPEYRTYAEAREAVENDDEAQEAIAEFEQVRQEFAHARQVGEATEESVRKVQESQAELHSLPVMEEYVEAQDELQSRLEEVNEAISAPLEVDFGGEAGGCCED